MVKKPELVLLLSTIIFLTGCANQMAPVGGEVDKIPPEVIESYPKNRTTNFNDSYLEIKFSEYVDKLSVQSSVFISPALQHGINYDWSGKSVTLEIKDTLQVNTTYTITVGTEVMDLNNRNKMVQPFTFAFSTGNKIDTAKISGKVYRSKTDGVMIYAYQSSSDVDPSKQKPNYVSQVGKNGSYSIVGLRDGDYKIFAMRDNMLDMLYQKNDDEYGVQSKKIELSPENTSPEHVDFFLTKEDTIAPKLNAAFMKDRSHLVVEFSEAVDSTKLSAANFTLVDTTTKKSIDPKYFYKLDARPNQFYLAFSDTSSFKDYFLFVSSFEDLHSNKTEVDKISFIYKAEKDTFPNSLLKAFGDLPDSKVDFENPLVSIQFADGIDIEEVKTRTVIEDPQKKAIEFAVTKYDDVLFQLSAKNKLKPGSEYIVKFNAKNLADISGKSVDTVYQRKFTTSTELDFSGASGVVEGADSTNVTVLESVSLLKKVYNKKNDSKKKFEFKKVIPGKYLIWTYKDKNNNGRYDSGSIQPFKYAEEFRYYNDTLNLRARWPVGDIIINTKD